MDYPIQADLKPGNPFPDIELPDQDRNPQRLSKLLCGFPGALVFGRGHY